MEKKKVKRYTRREVRRNRMIAFCCLVVLAILLIALIVWGIIQTMAARIHPFPELSNVAEKTHSY